MSATRTAPVTVAPRRLLFILKNGPVYTLSDHIEYQLKALSARFDCEIWSQGPLDLEQRLGPGQHARVVGSPNQFSPLAMARYVWRVVREARRCALSHPNSMVVLAHDPLKNGLIGMIVALAARAPLIVEVNGNYGSPDNYDSRRRSLAVTLRIGLHRLIARVVFVRAAAVRCLFAGQLAGFVSPPRRLPIRVFFDLPTLDRFHDAGERHTVLFVGFPFYTKGVDILIRAFEHVASSFPDWELLLIGHLLEEPVHSYTRNPQIRVLRAMSNAELAAHMNQAGIFVLPSRSEAMGRVLLEAAAAARPRIGARVGGIPTVISDGQDGLLFDKEDISGLAGRLAELMASPKLRRRLGAAARRRIEAEFSADAYVRHVDDLVSAAFGPPSASA